MWLLKSSETENYQLYTPLISTWWTVATELRKGDFSNLNSPSCLAQLLRLIAIKKLEIDPSEMLGIFNQKIIDQSAGSFVIFQQTLRSSTVVLGNWLDWALWCWSSCVSKHIFPILFCKLYSLLTPNMFFHPQVMIELILATDMKQHFTLTSHFSTLHSIEKGSDAKSATSLPAMERSLWVCQFKCVLVVRWIGLAFFGLLCTLSTVLEFSIGEKRKSPILVMFEPFSSQNWRFRGSFAKIRLDRTSRSFYSGGICK